MPPRLIFVAIFVSILALQQAWGANLMDIEQMRAKFEHSPERSSINTDIKPYRKQLDETLANAEKFREMKQQRMANLRNECNETTDLREKYALQSQLFSEYTSWNYDSMFYCSHRCLEIAEKIGDRNLIADAGLKMANTALIAGYFREAEQQLNEIDTAKCSIATRLNFIETKFNIYFEDGFYYKWHLHGYDIFLPVLQDLKNEVEKLSSPQSEMAKSMDMKIAFHCHNYKAAVNYSTSLLNSMTGNEPNYSAWVGNMGYNLMGDEKYSEAMRYMTESAIIDIKNGSNNVVAMRKIAELMYITGNIPEAYKYISTAMDNAIAYDSKYRVLEASRYYPSIDKNLYQSIERQRQKELAMMLILMSTLVLLAIAMFIVISQKKKQTRQQRVIASQNEELKEKSLEIENYNKSLIEAHHIKNIVLGQLLTKNADTQLWIEKLGKDVLRKLKVKDFDGIQHIFSNLKSSDSEMTKDIDHIILSIYPDFHRQFNSMLNDDSKIMRKDNNSLCPEMRIFALIRLGIRKNDDLAKCLNYSVNTIKSYKTKVVNMSDLSAEQFYEKLSTIVTNRYE